MTLLHRISVIAATTLVALTATTAHADHRPSNDIQRLSTHAADEARDLYTEIVREVRSPSMRVEMMVEARDVLIHAQKMRAYAQQGRLDRLHAEIESIDDSLKQLKRMTFEVGHVGRSDRHDRRQHGGDTRNIRHLIDSLRETVWQIDDLVHQLDEVTGFGSDRRFAGNGYPGSRPGIVATPNGFQVGGRGFSIQLGTR